MVEGTAPNPPLRRRRIIERPRLIRMLDESPERIKLLVAPAGYGKTTLARQWLSDAPVAWYSATSASTDVAALAHGLSAACEQVVPGCGTFLSSRLRATQNPDEEVHVLAELLATELRSWPNDAWVVIDDYEAFLGARSAERFVEALLIECPINLLVLSRRRPTWASARRLLYGEMQELDRGDLAMSPSEVRDVVRSAAVGDRLYTLTHGWPALVSLGSMAQVRVKELDVVPRLYAFFAEELFARMDLELRDRVAELALYEELDAVLGGLAREDADELVRQGTDAGFLTPVGDTVEIHPLLRQFLEGKLRQWKVGQLKAALAGAISSAITRRAWTEAYDLICRFDAREFLPALIEASMESLLETGRASTLRKWVDEAPEDSPSTRVAQAELAFRAGRFHESESLAGLAGTESVSGDSAARAYLLAGRAAHAASREEAALEHYQRAVQAAETEATRRRATLGELSAAIDLESPSAIDLLSTLGSPDALDPNERVVLVSRILNLETRFSLPISVEEGRRMQQLLPYVEGAVARSSFRNMFGYVLAAMGHLDEADRLTSEQLEEVEQYRLDFVIPYALTNLAMTHGGRRNFGRAEETLAEAEARAHHAGDSTAYCIAWGVRMRLCTSQGAFEQALMRPLPRSEEVTRSLRAEVLACAAVAAAALGENRRAQAYATEAEHLSGAIEVSVSVPCAQAIIALNETRYAEALSSGKRALERALRSGMIESFVSAYRGYPDLLVCLLEDSGVHESLSQLLLLAGDRQLAPVSAPERSVQALSPREKEVLALLAQGLSNPAIGEALFISPVTVKVHVRHIYEKLGVRSRAEAALRAAQLTRPQAT